MQHANRKAHALAKSLRRQMPEAEEKLWPHLRKKLLGGYKFRRQHPIGRFVVDFACVKEKLVVEIDGATHSTLVEREYDENRTLILQRFGWRVIRFSNDDVYSNVENVLENIYHHLSSTAAAGEVGPQGSEGATVVSVESNG